MEGIIPIMILVIAILLFLSIILVGRLKNSFARININLEKIARIHDVHKPSEDKILKNNFT